MPATALYASILGLLLFVLSARTIRLRQRLRIAIGDGSNKELLRAMRVHANFSEYVPLTLLLLLIVETYAGGTMLVHVFGGCLVAGRCIHAFGVSRLDEKLALRVTGMVLTFVALVGASLRLLLGFAGVF